MPAGNKNVNAGLVKKVNASLHPEQKLHINILKKNQMSNHAECLYTRSDYLKIWTKFQCLWRPEVIAKMLPRKK